MASVSKLRVKLRPTILSVENENTVTRKQTIFGDIYDFCHNIFVLFTMVVLYKSEKWRKTLPSYV